MAVQFGSHVLVKVQDPEPGSVLGDMAVATVAPAEAAADAEHAAAAAFELLLYERVQGDDRWQWQSAVTRCLQVKWLEASVE